MMELLAPAGNMDCVDACVKAGADAVYLGLDALNARRGAANFTPDELTAAAYKLHSHNMKLYVTVNTLVKDKEFGEVDRVVRAVAQAGADAAIIQDIGVAKYIKQALPSLKLHASTQMAIHNYQGVRWLKNMGFARAILAREVTLEDIAACADEGVEIEAFGHGALCVSCSGQCLMSSMVGGRSGNRGACAQPCRLKYSLGGYSGDLLSPKDLITIENLPALEKAGVKSLKLEGRLKPPQYVYAVVGAYRRALDGETPDAQSLRHVFNRGYTKGYYTGVDDGELVSDPDAEHVLPGDVSFEPREKKTALDITATVKAGEKLQMTARVGADRVEVAGDAVEKAQNAALDEISVSRQLCKTGGTPFEVKSFRCDIGENAFARVSSLNALRRECLELMTEKIVEKNRGCGQEIFPVEKPEIASPIARKPLLSVQSARPELLKIARENGADETVFEPSDAVDLPDNIEADALCVPPTLPGKDLDRLNLWALEKGFKATLVSNPAHLVLKWPGETRADWPMNVFNSYCVKALDMGYTPSLELTSGEISSLAGDKELVVYGRATLMRLRMCPLHAKRSAGAHDKCRACGDRLFLESPLVDRKNVRFPLMRLKTSAGCIISVLNGVPTMLLRRLDKIPKAQRWRVILTDEDEQTSALVVRAHAQAMRGEKIADYEFLDKMKTTTGHYFRGVDQADE